MLDSRGELYYYSQKVGKKLGEACEAGGKMARRVVVAVLDSRGGGGCTTTARRGGVGEKISGSQGGGGGGQLRERGGRCRKVGEDNKTQYCTRNVCSFAW